MTPTQETFGGLCACGVGLLFDATFWPCVVILALASLVAALWIVVWALSLFVRS